MTFFANSCTGLSCKRAKKCFIVRSNITTFVDNLSKIVQPLKSMGYQLTLNRFLHVFTPFIKLEKQIPRDSTSDS